MINTEQQQHTQPSRRLGELHGAHPEQEQPAVLSPSSLTNIGASDLSDTTTGSAHKTPWSPAWRIRLQSHSLATDRHR